MKARSGGLALHQAGETTTLARCWRFERRDGLILTVTNHDSDLVVSGETYSGQDGVVPTAISQEASAAVSNSEALGFLSVTGFTEDDVFSGKWDGAFITVFEVNYSDLTQGVMNLSAGNIGELEVGRNSFKAEVRGLTQSLQKQTGRVVTKGCAWKFGDPDTCRINLGPLTETGAFTSVTDLRTMTDTARVEAEDYWGAGVMTITSGDNDGVSMEIYSFAAGLFVLYLPLPFALEPGDTYSVTPGCRKDYTPDCLGKWANTNNFGGFPLLPGPDKVLGLGGTEGTNL